MGLIVPLKSVRGFPNISRRCPHGHCRVRVVNDYAVTVLVKSTLTSVNLPLPYSAPNVELDTSVRDILVSDGRWCLTAKMPSCRLFSWYDRVHWGWGWKDSDSIFSISLGLGLTNMASCPLNTHIKTLV